MIVDDMKMVRTSIRHFLKKLGYENTIEAENGRVAVEMHKNEKPDFIFMDMVMPEMTGNEALKKIRETSAETPVVMLTSVADKDVISECEAIGIAGYVIKPLTVETGPGVLGSFLKQ